MASTAEKLSFDPVIELPSLQSNPSDNLGFSRIMPFGRYRGQPLEQLSLDRPYLHWLLSQSWFLTEAEPGLVQALQALQQAIAQEPSDLEADRWFREGLQLKSEHHRRDAIRAFDQCLALSPAHLECLVEKAELEWPEQALRTLERGLGQFPGHPRLMMLKASQLETLERYREAIQTYETALEHLEASAVGAPGTPTTGAHTLDPVGQACRTSLGLSLMKWGSLTLQEGFFDESLKAFTRLHQRMEGEPVSWRMHALALIEMRRPGEALPWLDRALALSPLDDRSWKARGRALHALRRYREAALALEKSAQLNESDPDTWFMLGLSCDELERYARSVQAYDRAIALEPTDGFFWYSRGNAHYLLGNFALSLNDMEEAWSRDQELYHALFLKSMCLCQMGNVADAITVATRVIDLNPRDDEALYNRACYYGKCGNWERALDDLRAAISLDTEWRDAALEDEDFDPIRSHETFRLIVM